MIPVAICLPLPFDNWDTFQPFIKRFCDSFKDFPPGCDYTLYAMNIWGEPTDAVREMFYGLKARFVPYYGGGMDLGCAQTLAHVLPDDTFMVCATSRTYFHRKDWLLRLVQAREQHGPALFGVTASKEGGRLHLCTRSFCLDAAEFRRYPTKIVSRDQGVFFECGDGCLLEFMEGIGRKAYVVGWSGVYEKDKWFEIGHGFRRGSQNDVLIWDKHTEKYAQSDDFERERLTKLMLGAA